MFKENKDYLARKILLYSFFVVVFIVFVCSTIIVLNGDLLSLQLKIAFRLVCIIGLSLILAFFLFCLVEIIIMSIMKKKLLIFVENKEFNKGIEYLEKIPKLKVFFDLYEMRFFSLAILNLYLDNKEEATANFYKININSSLLKTTTFMDTILFLLLIYSEEDCQEENKKVLEQIFQQNIALLKRNKKLYENFENRIITIKKVFNNDFSSVSGILHKKMEIPLVKRVLENNILN